MPKCVNCGSTIVMGGKRVGQLRFCGESCVKAGAMLTRSHGFPEADVREQIRSVHRSPCPKCSGLGPIDVHVSHRVWSIVLLTFWTSRPELSCRKCGIKDQVTAAVVSMAFGWWALPLGPIMTPVQVVRNVAGCLHGPDPARPSRQLEKAVRVQMVKGEMELRERDAA